MLLTYPACLLLVVIGVLLPNALDWAISALATWIRQRSTR